ncbi:xylose isomerase-like protein [Stachybotrys elegans]|uniref:Xylose isomerase-like protein n=1 Tax=Stachybotrys elegans TaxID=80388 RepID=A0A8K0T7L0_9HYPO|nr:xylose isomerase-like protein [Stachybotrys elegans]
MYHKPSICSMSLGRSFAGHSLLDKLEVAARYGFHGIELFYEDLHDFAALTTSSQPSPDDLVTAATAIRNKCTSLNLSVVCLQPFMHYEGLVSRSAHQQRLEELKVWFRLVHALGTDLMVIPSSFLSADKVTADMDLIVADLRKAADMALQQTPVVRIAYEAICWATRVTSWEDSWEAVQRVDRPNFGLCLDTFNMAGKMYADPCTATRCTPDADAVVARSLKRLVATVDVSRVFLLQIADGERLPQVLDSAHPFHLPEQPPRMSWSRNARLFYGEDQYNAYLPTKAILKAIVKGLGFQGWLSFEVFNRVLAETDHGVPEEMARRASASWAKMVKDVGLVVDGQDSRVQAML